MFDVSKPLYAELWWNFKNKISVRENFMWKKYCKIYIPQIVEWKKGSQTWMYMLEVRDFFDKKSSGNQGVEVVAHGMIIGHN